MSTQAEKRESVHTNRGYAQICISYTSFINGIYPWASTVPMVPTKAAAGRKVSHIREILNKEKQHKQLACHYWPRPRSLNRDCFRENREKIVAIWVLLCTPLTMKLQFRPTIHTNRKRICFQIYGKNPVNYPNRMGLPVEKPSLAESVHNVHWRWHRIWHGQ